MLASYWPVWVVVKLERKKREQKALMNVDKANMNFGNQRKIL